MTADAALYDLDSLYLEIDPRQQDRFWQQSQSLSTGTSRWCAYLNQLGLTTFMSWLQSEGFAAKSALAKPLLPTVWELVTGSAIECLLGGQDTRLIVLPTEAIDSDELRVPQAWIDIPSWVGDYYLSLQVNPDEGWVRMAGFTTHQTLKTRGSYDWRDRTYSLDAADLTADINVLQIAQNLYPEAIKRAPVAALPALSVAQAHQLIERLGNAEAIREPRLAVGFEQWGSLLAHGGWRRQLAERRWGQMSLPVRQWLQSGLTQLASQIGWQQITYQPATAAARSAEVISGQSVLCRELNIAGETYTLQVMPLASIAGPGTDQASDGGAWRFELTRASGAVSPGVALRLLTEDLQPFENNSAIATEAIDRLYVDVALAEQEGIVWQVQPVPSQYDEEILRF